MRVVGVDPGLNGGVMAYDGERPADGFRIPSKKADFGRGRELDYRALVIHFNRIVSLGVSKAYVERNSARPGQGVASMYKFGYVSGVVHGLLLAYQIPVELVTPQVWKRDQLGGRKGKIAAIEMCEERWGDDFGGHDGMCDAALIAVYGWKQMQERMEENKYLTLTA